MEWKNLAKSTRSMHRKNRVRSRTEALHDFGCLVDQVEYDQYERPAIHVVGTVRDLTGGSSSSGRKDANSQYYW